MPAETATPARRRASSPKRRWTEAEEGALRAILSGGGVTWGVAAERLGTGRTGVGVMQHWKAISGTSPVKKTTPARTQTPPAKPIATVPQSRLRIALAALAFILLVLANLGQHAWHPPLALCEAQAALDLGGSDWRVRFDPYKLTDGVKKWTPAHEARLQDFAGKGAYLTVITVFGQCTYQGLSLLAELKGAPAASRLTQFVYASASFVNALGVLVCSMFLFFWWAPLLWNPATYQSALLASYGTPRPTNEPCVPLQGLMDPARPH